MVTHGSDNSSFSGFLQLLTLNEGVVEVVALGLLPNIVRGVITGPQNKINIVSFLELFDEEHVSLERQVAVAQTAPISGWPLVIFLGFKVLFIHNSVKNLLVR